MCSAHLWVFDHVLIEMSWDFTEFSGDFRGFNGISWRFHGDSMGFNWYSKMAMENDGK